MAGAGATIVAKRGKKPPEPKEQGWGAKKLVFQMRGSLEYETWLKGLADFDATSLSEMAERAFASYARSIGYVKLRPKR